MSNEKKEINIELEGVDPSQEEERKMYIGSRRSSTRCEEIEYLYRGSIQDVT